jgi:predicted ester cyclase
MSAEQVVRSYFDALEAKDLARLNEVVSPDLVFVTPLRPLGKQDLLRVFSAIFDAFPDWRFDHQELVTAGDTVKTKLRMTGTHTGTFVPPIRALKPIKATGKKVVLPEQEFVYYVDSGKIARIVSEPVPDGGIPGLLTQLGVRLPPLWLIRLIAKVSGLVRRGAPSA